MNVVYFLIKLNIIVDASFCRQFRFICFIYSLKIFIRTPRIGLGSAFGEIISIFLVIWDVLKSVHNWHFLKVINFHILFIFFIKIGVDADSVSNYLLFAINFNLFLPILFKKSCIYCNTTCFVTQKTINYRFY